MSRSFKHVCFRHIMRTPCVAKFLEKGPNMAVQQATFIDSIHPAKEDEEYALSECELDITQIVALLRKCGYSKALVRGKKIHEYILNSGKSGDRYLANLLIQMYGRCGALNEARMVFDDMTKKNTFSWNLMIGAYVQHDQVKEARKLFDQMPLRDAVSWTAMVSAYAKHGKLNEALQLFQLMPCRDTASWNAMIAGYAQHGQLKNAFGIFQQMPNPNVVSWTALISGFTQKGMLDEALQLFLKMPAPDVLSWSIMITAYAQHGDLEDAIYLFHQMPTPNVVSCNAILGAYMKHGCLIEAVQLFEQMSERDVISWTTMISGYVQQGNLNKAVELFHRMPERNEVAWTALISGYIKDGCLNEALELFQRMPHRDVVSWNTMIMGYAQNGLLKEAMQLFQQMPQRNPFSWNAIISGYSRLGQLRDALDLFNQMELEGIQPEESTFVAILDACASQAALAEGKQLHTSAINIKFTPDVILKTALVNMYAKCGSMKDACDVFGNMLERWLVSWNIMIAAYTQHGYDKEALDIFQQMQLEGAMPNEVTFLSLLSICSFACLLDEGYHYLISMNPDYGIIPTLQHYTCIIDLVRHNGNLDEGEAFLNMMPVEPDVTCWRSFLASCKIHADAERAQRAAEHAVELDAEDAAAYILLSNTYATT